MVPGPVLAVMMVFPIKVRYPCCRLSIFDALSDAIARRVDLCRKPPKCI